MHVPRPLPRLQAPNPGRSRYSGASSAFSGLRRAPRTGCTSCMVGTRGHSRALTVGGSPLRALHHKSRQIDVTCVPVSQGDRGAAPPLGGPACPPAPWTGAGGGGRQSQVPAASAGTPLPAAPAPTFTRVAQQDGFRAAFCLPRSPERQPHAASSVSQAFKLPFYLNLCPRIQAEKGPFQSQFLFYGFMGDRMGQLPLVPHCSQHRRGSRGSGCSGRNPFSQRRGSR